MIAKKETTVTTIIRYALALGCIAAVALAAPPAQSQTQTAVVEIDQVQLNDVWSDMTVEIPETAWDASTTSPADGNAAAGLVMQGNVDLDVTQALEGNVRADNQ